MHVRVLLAESAPKPEAPSPPSTADSNTTARITSMRTEFLLSDTLAFTLEPYISIAYMETVEVTWPAIISKKLCLQGMIKDLLYFIRV